MGIQKYKPNRTPRLVEDRIHRIMAEARKTVKRAERAVRNSESLVTKSGQAIDDTRKLLLLIRLGRNGERQIP